MACEPGHHVPVLRIAGLSTTYFTCGSCRRIGCEAPAHECVVCKIQMCEDCSASEVPTQPDFEVEARSLIGGTSGEEVARGLEDVTDSDVGALKDAFDS